MTTGRNFGAALAFGVFAVNVWTIATRLGDADRCEAHGSAPALIWKAPLPVDQMLLVECYESVPVPQPKPAPVPQPCEVC